MYNVLSCDVKSLGLQPGSMKKDTSVNVRLTSELRLKLQRLADADGRKLSNYIERILSAHVQRMDDREKARAKGAGA